VPLPFVLVPAGGTRPPCGWLVVGSGVTAAPALGALPPGINSPWTTPVAIVATTSVLTATAHDQRPLRRRRASERPVRTAARDRPSDPTTVIPLDQADQTSPGWPRHSRVEA
jgi:hypothetical protein